jgi:hypothetical protein
MPFRHQDHVPERGLKSNGREVEFLKSIGYSHYDLQPLRSPAALEGRQPFTKLVQIFWRLNAIALRLD